MKVYVTINKKIKHKLFENIIETIKKFGYKIYYSLDNHQGIHLFHCGDISDFEYCFNNHILLKLPLELLFRLKQQLKPPFEKINLGGKSWIKRSYLPKYMLEFDFDELWNLHPPEKGIIKMFGKEIRIPRWQQVFGMSYFYSGIYHKALPMTPFLKKLLKWCRKINPDLNGCIVNWYDNNKSYIGPHSDNTEPLLPNSEIWTLSFGATRTMLVEKKKNLQENFLKKKLTLRNGAIIIMGGTCQHTHKHSIPKDKIDSGKRVSVTFRCFKELD